MTKKFTAQTGSATQVKVFDAATGQLFKIINVGGTITGQPVVSESEMTVAIRSSNKNFMKTFKLPSGSLKNQVSLN